MCLVLLTKYTAWMCRINIIQLIKLHLKWLKKDLLMTVILFFMLWGIFLAVTRVSRIHLQFLIASSASSWNSWVIPSFSAGSQQMTPAYVSSYGLVEQISELQDELQYLQHQAENILPRERGRCTDELWVALAHCAQTSTTSVVFILPIGHLTFTSLYWQDSTC